MTANASLQKLKSDSLAIRRRLLKMHFAAKSGHIGSSLSSIDLLTFLYGEGLRRPANKPGDELILSKGHAASGLYATLAHYGLLSEGEIATYYQDNTLLPAHPAPNGVRSILAATGALGHGFPIAAGLAFSHKYLLPKDSRVVCLLSDGECDEGSVWEAALFSNHHQLDNLVIVVDANGLQGFGQTEKVMRLEPFLEKWNSFGFTTHEVDGHDFAQMQNAFSKCMGGRGPYCIVARTTKGKGVSFMENRLEWHYLPMDAKQFEDAMAELGEAA